MAKKINLLLICDILQNLNVSPCCHIHIKSSNWILLPIDSLSAVHCMVIICFLQVQLLVSESDVENYKQIKADLDELRLLVEKSELWVYKAKPDEGKDKKKKKKPEEEGKVITAESEATAPQAVQNSSVNATFQCKFSH